MCRWDVAYNRTDVLFVANQVHVVLETVTSWHTWGASSDRISSSVTTRGSLRRLLVVVDGVLSVSTTTAGSLCSGTLHVAIRKAGGDLWNSYGCA